MKAILPLLLAAPIAACAPAPEPPRDWNVLLITLDTTRADVLGCYGFEKETSPNLDALAAGGVRFEQCFATAAVTPVSHASILTGLNPYRHGLRVIHAGSHYRLDEGVPYLPEILRDAGWHTGATLSAFTVSEHFGLARGFAEEDWDNGLGGDAEEHIELQEDGRAKWNIRDGQRRSDATTDEAIRFVEGARDPFFLWVHYWDPHDLQRLPPDEVLGAWVPKASGRSGPPREAYEAEVFYMDAQIGRLLSALQLTGKWENTLIAVISDHGEGLGDHDWPGHRLLYQEQLRLPLILRLPEGPGKRVVGELVRSIDLFPTLLEALRLPLPEDLEGRSLLGLIAGEAEPPRLAYADALNLFDLNAMMIEKRPDDDLIFMMTDGRWKLIFRSLRPEESELYDLGADAGELTNLFADRPEIARRLLRELESRDPWPPEEGFGEAVQSEEVQRYLNELGYVDDGEAEE